MAAAPNDGAEVFGRHSSADPYPAYERQRAAGPISGREGSGNWTVLGYMAARQVLRDETFLTDDVFRHMLPRLGAATGQDFAALQHLLDCIVFYLDPPVHAPARRLLARLLARRPVSELWPAAQALVARQLRQAQQAGGFDLVRDFARKIPAGILALILGIPEEDLTELTKHSEKLIELFDVLLPMRVFRRVDDAACTLVDYFGSLIRKRRRAAGEDGISYMMRLAVDQPGIGDADLAGLCAFIFGAGHETTASFLAGAAAILSHNPTAMAELRETPAKLPQAVDELLRHHSPVQIVSRVASAGRSVAGRKIAAGDRLAIFLGAANRDPSVYPVQSCPALHGDAPPHLAFGDGRHFCLGAALARMEGVAALGGLLALPRMQIDFERAVWAGRRNLRGLVSLPVKM
jgi:cytochrome P450